MSEKMLPVKEKDRQVKLLNQDYALWCGQLAIDDEHGHNMSPMVYLEAYMGIHEQPPYEVCVQFLLQFYTYDSVSEWANKIAWVEDESYEIAREFIRESVADGTWAVMLYQCRAIEERYALNWEDLGFEDLVGSGRIDQEIWNKYAGVVMEYLKGSDQGAIEMIVENLQEEIAELMQEDDIEEKLKTYGEFKVYALEEAEWTNVVCALRDVADIYTNNLKNMEGEDREGCEHDLILTQSLINKFDPEGII